MAVTRLGLCTGRAGHISEQVQQTVGETLEGPENANTCFSQESDFYRT